MRGPGLAHALFGGSPRILSALAPPALFDSSRTRRQAAIAGLPLLQIRPEARELARRFVSGGPLPPKAEVDAAHIALAAVHGVEYLLTWNCKHIANAEMQPALTRIANAQGYALPVLCTPEQLMGEE